MKKKAKVDGICQNCANWKFDRLLKCRMCKVRGYVTGPQYGCSEFKVGRKRGEK